MSIAGSVGSKPNASMHHNESSTEHQPFPETTRFEEKEERLTDSSVPKAEILDEERLEVNDEKEFLGPVLMCEETDDLEPRQWEQHPSDEDIQKRQTWEEPWEWQLVMGPGKARVQEPLEEPPPEKPKAPPPCKGRNKIPPNVSYESSLRTSKENQNVVCDMRRYQ